MNTYTERNISIATRKGHETVKAWCAGNGLAYHASHGASYMRITWQAGERVVEPLATSYTVTHIASGQRICKQAHFLSPAQCQALIERISAITNWTCKEPILTPEQQIAIQMIALHLSEQEIPA